MKATSEKLKDRTLENEMVYGSKALTSLLVKIKHLIIIHTHKESNCLCKTEENEQNQSKMQITCEELSLYSAITMIQE